MIGQQLEILKQIVRILKDADDIVKATPKISEAELIDFFNANPDPKDSAVHAWAEKAGIAPDVLEGMIYTLATKYAGLMRGGRSSDKGVTVADVDAAELKAGIAVEAEHAEDIGIRTKIALDHLAELPDYYTRLAAMEAGK